ncbi:hypothetical protein QF028_000131 [Neobacillus sp. B4I6]|uniref:transposase n=1 Tax=Neobacillus sp. B4I6 TaxID=3373925 RepID=UPI003D19181D
MITPNTRYRVWIPCSFKRVRASNRSLPTSLLNCSYYEWHTQNIKTYDQEIERIFVETDGLLLLTFPGIGLVTADGYYGRISKQGNSNLRRAIYMAGRSLSAHNNALKPFYSGLKDRGKKAGKIYIAMGNKFLKIAFAMLKNQSPFKWDNPTFNYKDEVTKKLTFPRVA